MSSISEEVKAALTVEGHLELVNYSGDEYYIPSDFALGFINFIKLVNGEEGEEHLTPVMHYKMLDQIAGKESNIANMCSRGLAKSAIFAEYLFLYLAVYGEIEGFGRIKYALYVTDSIDNGVKKMRKRINRRIDNSDFLKQYLKEYKFTDIYWYFKNIDGDEFVVTAHGAKTGVRGTVELNSRPQLAVLDDLISDADARSDTIINAVEDTIYSAIDYALHPTKNKIIWSGTPFNARDPLYKAIESGAWAVNVFPICEKFPCTKEEFKGAWEDRFTFEYVQAKYDKAIKMGKIDSFNQELMLRIISEEERLISDGDIQWYDQKMLIKNKHQYNFYITTDFAFDEDEANDFSVISVWAYNSAGHWMWVDGICKRQDMNQNIIDLFSFVQKYKPQEVGIEVSGQQTGFISIILARMVEKNTYFNLASDGNKSKPGIRPNTNKIARFKEVAPYFKTKSIWFPKELKFEECMIECMDELRLVTAKGFKSRHDDFADTISMLSHMHPWKPSADAPEVVDGAHLWDDDEPPDESNLDSYIV